MSENNNTEAMLKQLMDMVAKQNDEIAKLKEVKPTEPSILGSKLGFASIVEEPKESPFEESAKILKTEEDIRKKVELEYKSKEIINNFDEKYGLYLTKEDLTIINNSNADTTHKVVEKFTRIFKNESNLELIPSILKDDVKKIISLNDTDKAKFNDVEKINTILNTFLEVKEKVDFNNLKFLGVNTPKRETIAESKWKEAIAKANGKAI